jgi:hypothetical protein
MSYVKFLASINATRENLPRLYEGVLESGASFMAATDISLKSKQVLSTSI